MAKGGKIDLRGWNKLYAKVRAAAAQDARVKVGVFGSAGMHDGGISMVNLAAVHEFGSPARGIPERSFLRRTFTLREEDIKKLTAKITKKFVEGTLELDQALGLMGQWMVAAVRNTITSKQVVPRLEESAAGRRTIKRKGSTTTLVDHSQLINAISYQVVGVEAPELADGEVTAVIEMEE